VYLGQDNIVKGIFDPNQFQKPSSSVELSIAMIIAGLLIFCSFLIEFVFVSHNREKLQTLYSTIEITLDCFASPDFRGFEYITYALFLVFLRGNHESKIQKHQDLHDLL